MRWNDIYQRAGRIWGEGPSELAVAAVRYLQEHKLDGQGLSILDIGCGYGRDALYFLSNLRCKVLGVDPAPKAVEIALGAVPQGRKGDATFRCCSFTELGGSQYDVVSTSNLYQVLGKGERGDLVKAAREALKPGGLLFLSTLSVSDPEHYGKGAAVPGDPHSFLDRTFLHFSTREELLQDFAFLALKELYAYEYYEPHSEGTHHHISWILIGQLPVEGV